VTENTSLQEAIVEKGEDPNVCSIHKPLVTVITALSRRMRRVEIVGLALLAMTAGLLGKDLLVPLLLKILAGS
jgi:hypothetical protein